VRSALVIAEMALALVLLIGAGLMVRSFFALQQVRLGFDPSGVLTFRLALPFPKYANPELRRATLRQTEERLRELPGVTEVGFVSQLPLTGSGPLSPYAYNDATARNWESETSDGRNVSPSYFRAMGTRLVAGRFFDEHDAQAGRRIIVDTTLALRAWPEGNPVGKRLQVAPTGTPEPFAEVVGVVEHIRAHDLSRAVRPQIYSLTGPAGRLDVVIRTSGEPSALTGPVRDTMRELDPDVPVDRLRPMTAYTSAALAETRLSLLLMSLFGASALMLSCVGIYGVFSYVVGQRTREIGIRMALGQEPGQIRNLVLREGVRLIAIGTLIGIAAAFVLAKSAAALLFQVRPGDPYTFSAMAALLIVVALAGCWVPARRATNVNPLVALKLD
jgi:predicted permease